MSCCGSTYYLDDQVSRSWTLRSLTVLVPGLISLIPILLSGLLRNKTKYLLFGKCTVLLLWSVTSTVLIFLIYYPQPWFQVLTSCISYPVLVPSLASSGLFCVLVPGPIWTPALVLILTFSETLPCVLIPSSSWFAVTRSFFPLICYFLSRYQVLNPWYSTSFPPTGSNFFVLVPDLDLPYVVPSLLVPLLNLCDHVLIPGFDLVHLLPPVLVPGLDLGVAELQWGGQLHTVLNAQVLLLLEAPLQPRQLLVAECRPSFAGLLQTSGAVFRGPTRHCWLIDREKIVGQWAKNVFCAVKPVKILQKYPHSVFCFFFLKRFTLKEMKAVYCFILRKHHISKLSGF